MLTPGRSSVQYSANSHGDRNPLDGGTSSDANSDSLTFRTQLPPLTASDGAAGDRFDLSVSLGGDYAIVGATFGDGNGTNSGSACVFMK